jgi:hypothetical protein
MVAIPVELVSSIPTADILPKRETSPCMPRLDYFILAPEIPPT